MMAEYEGTIALVVLPSWLQHLCYRWNCCYRWWEETSWLIVHVEPNAQSWMNRGSSWKAHLTVYQDSREGGRHSRNPSALCQCSFEQRMLRFIVICTKKQGNTVTCKLFVGIKTFAYAKHNHRPAEAHVKTGEQVQLMRHSKHNLCSQ